MGRPRDASALVLCGGRSSRFGSDKALATLGGRTLLEHVVLAAQERFAQVAVVAKDASIYAAHASGAALIDDGSPAQTPLAGLVAGLQWSPADLVFAVGVDMPFAFDDALLAALFAAIEGRAAAVPELRGTLQPLCGLWRRSAALEAARKLLGGELMSEHSLMNSPGPHALALQLGAAIVPWDDGRPFLDADTPEALAAMATR